MDVFVNNNNYTFKWIFFKSTPLGKLTNSRRHNPPLFEGSFFLLLNSYSKHEEKNVKFSVNLTFTKLIPIITP